jgi:hypothetical protein
VITDVQRDGALTRDQTPISAFVCPTRRSAILYPRASMAYKNGRPVPFAGVLDYAGNSGDSNPIWDGGPSSMAEALKPWPGWESIGFDRNTGVCYTRSEVRLAQVSDGTSNTYMIGEKYLPSDRYHTGKDPTDDFGMYEGSAHDTHRWCTLNDPVSDVGLTPLRDTPGLQAKDSFGSPHAACHFVMCDGSVRGVSYSIEAHIHARFGNRSDGLPVESN